MDHFYHTIQANYYRLSDTGCTACKCNSHGSSILQCDESGKCPCLPDVEGMKCDTCKAGYFGLPAMKCEGALLLKSIIFY